VESLKNVSLEVSEELITQSRCHLFKKCWKNPIKFKNMYIFWKMSEHFQNVTCTSICPQ
jgi:hypothetical protein